MHTAPTSNMCYVAAAGKVVVAVPCLVVSCMRTWVLTWKEARSAVCGFDDGVVLPCGGCSPRMTKTSLKWRRVVVTAAAAVKARTTSDRAQTMSLAAHETRRREAATREAATRERKMQLHHHQYR